MNILIDLFATFFKIGLFTFGGGYAMISLIEYNCVEKKKWISHEDMINIVIISESTPGPIAVNCSTFVGYKKAGVKGAVIATLGVILPSFFIIFVISKFLTSFFEIKTVSDAFFGIKIAVGLLIAEVAVNMAVKMYKSEIKEIKGKSKDKNKDNDKHKYNTNDKYKYNTNDKHSYSRIISRFLILIASFAIAVLSDFGFWSVSPVIIIAGTAAAGYIAFIVSKIAKREQT